MPAGVLVDVDHINRELARRQVGYGRGARTAKIERDEVIVSSGVASNHTTGAPVALRITNRDFANQPAVPKSLRAPRPGHADLAGGVKYGVDDFRLVRERASARETAARVAAGSLVRCLLDAVGIRLGSFVLSIGTAVWNVDLEHAGADDLQDLASRADADDLRCPDPVASDAMRAATDAAKQAGETLGGTFCVVATNVPIGLGSHVHWDRKLDGRLAQAMCSIHAIKGVEFGPAFQLAQRAGRAAIDAIGVLDGTPVRGSNRAGGLEGGITNGAPLVVRAAMKPLSSVRAEVTSVDVSTGLPADAPYVRSDVSAVPAAAVVGEAMVAWVLAEALLERFGGDRLDLILNGMQEVERCPLGIGGQDQPGIAVAGAGVHVQHAHDTGPSSASSSPMPAARP